MFKETFKPKEENTRERYDEAKENADSIKKELNSLPPIIKRAEESKDPFIDADELRSFEHFLKRQSDEAHKRVTELYGKSEEEALALNEEYNRLSLLAVRAMRALETFEKEKLGMHQENSDSSGEQK